MGWDSMTIDRGESTRAVLIREHSQIGGTRANGEFFPQWTVTDLSILGREAYAIIRIDYPDGSRWHGRVILFERKKRNGREDEFSYKSMGEDIEPFYYRAPAKLIAKLEKVSPVDPESGAGKWRAQCKAHHAQKKARPAYAAGQLWTHKTGAILELIAPHSPRMGWIVRRADGVPHSGRASFALLSKLDFLR